MKEALYYEKLKDKKVKCNICPHHCTLAVDKIGLCNGRTNKDGKMIATNYGQSTSLAIDPIEKKPLYHFYPTQKIMSTSANSCNFKCEFCQNFAISQQKASTQTITPQQLVEQAKRFESVGIAYTYTEPMVWYEFVKDCSVEMHKAELKNVFVSNGYINEEPLKELLPYIDAINIDLKSMDNEFYKTHCGGTLDPVLSSIEIVNNSSAILEITNLLIPSLNDSEKQIQELVDWIAQLNKNIPLHFSAYHPSYKFSLPRTSPEKMITAYNIAKEKLNYVYLGNLNIRNTGDTYCPNCKAKLIERTWYHVQVLGLDGDKCKKCGEKIHIIV